MLASAASEGFHGFVVFLDGAQRAVEEPGLPEFAVGTPVLVDRVLGRGEAAPRPYLMASEIVTGYTGAPMQCPAAAGSGRKTQAVRQIGCSARARLKARANRAESGSVNFSCCLSRRTTIKKYRSEGKGRRSFDPSVDRPGHRRADGR